MSEFCLSNRNSIRFVDLSAILFRLQTYVSGVLTYSAQNIGIVMLLNLSMLENPLVGCMTRLLWLRALLSTGTPVDCKTFSFTVSFWLGVRRVTSLTGSTIRYEPCFSSEGRRPVMDSTSAGSPLRKWGNEAAIGKSANETGSRVNRLFSQNTRWAYFRKTRCSSKKLSAETKFSHTLRVYRKPKNFLTIASPTSLPTTDLLIEPTRVSDELTIIWHLKDIVFGEWQ